MVIEMQRRDVDEGLGGAGVGESRGEAPVGLAGAAGLEGMRNEAVRSAGPVVSVARLERDQSGFAFVVDDGRPQVSDQDMLEGLRRFWAERGGKVFTMKEFDGWAGKPCCATSITGRFGRWWEGLRKAGLSGVRWGDAGPEALMLNLREIWMKKGRMPSGQDLRQFGLISMGPYSRRWGSVRRACERLAAFERGEISKEQLLADEKRKGGVRKRHGLLKGVRWRVLERDGHRCRACGRKAGKVNLEVDHIVPVSKGGSDALSNLRTLCEACNRGRGARWKGKGRAKAERKGREGCARWGRGGKKA